MSLAVVETARIPDECPVSVWRDILRDVNRYSFFQTPRWAEILSKVLPHARPCHRWFSFSDGSEAVFPAFAVPVRFGIRKLDSMYWGSYGGLISSSPLTPRHYLAAARYDLDWKTPICDVTLNPADLETTREFSNTRLFQVIERTTHILHLDEPFETIWKERIKSRNRTTIRRAKRDGVQTRWSNDARSIDTIKTLYQKACKRWQGVETLPLSFFDALVDLPGDEVRIWRAEYEGEIIAIDVMFYGKGEALYHSGARNDSYSELNGSKLLMADMIQDASERNISVFNFGASGGLQGVERFKEIFGGEKTTYLTLRIKHPLLRFLPFFIEFFSFYFFVYYF